MSEISETQSKLDELMNEYEVAVIGENRGRNRSGYSEKADKYYQKRRELKEFVAKIEGKVTRLLTERDDAIMAEARYIAKDELAKRDARIAELEAERRWIPVSEGLPEVNEDVFTVVYDTNDGSTSVSALKHHGDGVWFTWDKGYYVVTHWMPLPEPPIVYGKECEE